MIVNPGMLTTLSVIESLSQVSVRKDKFISFSIMNSRTSSILGAKDLTLVTINFGIKLLILCFNVVVLS